MKISKQELLETLINVKPALPSKGALGQAYFNFNGNEIVTYNESFCISHPFTSDFKCSVIADKFQEIVDKITSKNIDIVFKDNALTIKGGSLKSQIKVPVDNPIDDFIKEINFPSKKDYTKLPKNFLDGIDYCLFSALKVFSTNMPYLNWIFVDKERIVSSDNISLSIYELESKIKESFFVLLESAKALVEIEYDRYCIDDTWAFFSNDDKIVLCSRVVDDEIGRDEMSNAYKHFDFKKTKLMLPDEFKKIVDTASIFADGEKDINKEISVMIKDDSILCRGENDIGWSEVPGKLKKPVKKEIQFVINPVFLSRILKETDTMFVGSDRVMFEFGDFKHLIMLIIR